MKSSNPYVTEVKTSVVAKAYMLLAAALATTAISATMCLGVTLSLLELLLIAAGLIITLFALVANRKNEPVAVLLMFVLSALDGCFMGPIVNQYLQFPNGVMIVAGASALTAATFLALSLYVIFSKKNFNFLGGILFMALIGLVLVSPFGMFVSTLHLSVAYVGVLVFSGFILHDTSRLIRGEEDNYVFAAVDLYLNILNLFVDFLRILKR